MKLTVYFYIYYICFTSLTLNILFNNKKKGNNFAKFLWNYTRSDSCPGMIRRQPSKGFDHNFLKNMPRKVGMKHKASMIGWEMHIES